ncbi:MAG: hypothetical protein J7K12_02790 [Thermoplasmata archaeon]|nr:hypothetical protein [Thermoplasmata archaeon]
MDGKRSIEIIRFKEILSTKKSVWEGDKIIAIGFPRKKDFRYVFKAHY